MKEILENTIIYPLIESVKRVNMVYIDGSSKVRYSAKLKDKTTLVYEIDSRFQEVLTIDEWIEYANKKLENQKL